MVIDFSDDEVAMLKIILSHASRGSGEGIKLIKSMLVKLGCPNSPVTLFRLYCQNCKLEWALTRDEWAVIQCECGKSLKETGVQTTYLTI